MTNFKDLSKRVMKMTAMVGKIAKFTSLLMSARRLHIPLLCWLQCGCAFQQQVPPVSELSAQLAVRWNASKQVQSWNCKLLFFYTL